MIKNIQKINFVNFLISILIMYFLYHSIMGKYGVISYVESYSNLQKKEKLFKGLLKDIAFQKNKINRMSSSNVDVDILDEEMRKKFGYAKKNEIVIYSEELEE